MKILEITKAQYAERAMSTMSLTIGWIGLGKMGLPICRRLRTAGYDVTVFVRNALGRERAVANGFAAVDSIAALSTSCDVVFAAISDDAALTEIVAGPGALSACLKSNQVFVDTSTVSPAASQEAAKLLAATGARYLRAPLSGSTAMAEAGNLTTFVSGPKAIFERLTPVLAAYTRKQFHVGEGEEARHLKLAINLLVGATAALLGEALSFGRKGGLETAMMLEVISQSAVASPLIDYKRKMLIEQDFTPAFTVQQIMKDYDLLLATGRAESCRLPLAALVREQFAAVSALGHGQSDFFVVAASGVCSARP